MTKKICILAGARPNFVKVAPLVRAISGSAEAECLLVYAGCEDDPTLEASLFDDLQIPRPQFFLGVDSVSLNEITSRVMAQFDAFLNDHPVDVVIVVDDLASTMAAAIVTKKRAIRLAHLVAGTRSFNINMPKEINRLVIDALSDYLFTAGVRSTGVATREQSEQSQTFMVGNILMIHCGSTMGASSSLLRCLQISARASISSSRSTVRRSSPIQRISDVCSRPSARLPATCPSSLLCVRKLLRWSLLSCLRILSSY